MPDIASVVSCTTNWRANQKWRHIRYAVLAAILSAMPFFASVGHATIDSSSSTPPTPLNENSVVTAEIIGTQPVIRRGRDPSENKLVRAEAIRPNQEFAPQPSTIRAKMPLVSPAAAAAHDAEAGKDLSSEINGNNTIETTAKLNPMRTHGASSGLLLQNFGEPVKGLLRGSGVTTANGIVTNDAPPGPASIEELARALRYDADYIYQYVYNNIEIDPVRGIHKGGVDTHTLYPNGSNYQRLNPHGHANNPIPHGHGHAVGTGPGMKAQGSSLDVNGNVVPWNSPAAHWPIY